MKKIFQNILIISLVAVVVVGASTQFAHSVKAEACVDPSKCAYVPLEPLPGYDSVTFDNNFQIADWVNLIIKIIIGIVGALSVVMIIIGGVQYMSTDAIGKKEDGKETIQNSVFGLILALASVLILKTINPQLTALQIGINKVSVGPLSIGVPADLTVTTNMDSDIASVEGIVTNASGKNYQMSGSYAAPKSSPGVREFIASLQGGYSIEKIKVSTSAKTATFTSTGNTSVTVPINIGKNGTSNPPAPKSGDFRTPKGIYTMTGRDVRVSRDQNTAVFNGSGANMGAAYVNTDITLNGTNRGIGFHGQATNKLGATAGCIKMYNDDILVLAPYMKKQIQLIIE